MGKDETEDVGRKGRRRLLVTISVVVAVGLSAYAYVTWTNDSREMMSLQPTAYVDVDNLDFDSPAYDDYTPSAVYTVEVDDLEAAAREIYRIGEEHKRVMFVMERDRSDDRNLMSITVVVEPPSDDMLNELVEYLRDRHDAGDVTAVLPDGADVDYEHVVVRQS